MPPGRDSCPDHTDQPCSYYPTYCSSRLQLWPFNNHPNGLKLWGPPGIHYCLLFCTMMACSPTEKQTKTFSCPFCSSVLSSLRKICKKCCPHFSVIFPLLPSPSIEKWLAMPQKFWALKTIFPFILFSSLLIFAFGSYFLLLFLIFFFLL